MTIEPYVSGTPEVKIGDVWFRYEQRAYTSFDSELERVTSIRYELELINFQVDKITPKGVWLTGCVGSFRVGKARFVRFSAKKRLAQPTKAAALESFKQRKLRQIGILQAQLNVAKRMLARAEGMLNADSTGKPITESLLALEG